MRKQRKCISKEQRHLLRQSVANTATIMAVHRARVAALEAVEKAAITGEDLSGGGKKYPAKLPTSGIKPLTQKPKKEDEESVGKDVKLYADVLKANAEEQTVTGVVLQPETVDAQGDIYSAEVIRKAAEGFLSRYNRATKLGLQHKKFNKKFELLQSYIAPADFAMGGRTVKAGSWVMKVKVVDSGVWKLVKEGKIRGFSIGGKARVVQLKAA